MLWKSVFGAAAVGLVLAGPAHAAQEAQNAGDRNDSAKSYQRFLSATKLFGLSEVLGGNSEWDLSASMDRAFDSFGDGNADAHQNLGNTDLAEVINYHLLPGQKFDGLGSTELLELESKNWQRFIMGSSDNVFAIDDSQLAIEALPAES